MRWLNWLTCIEVESQRIANALKPYVEAFLDDIRASKKKISPDKATPAASMRKV